LNSILIENLTQGTDTTLYEPDTVLIMDVVTTIGKKEPIRGNSFSISQNYPNPVYGSTTVSLYLPDDDKVLITIVDPMGRDLLQKEFLLESGKHLITFVPGRESIYFLTAQVNHKSYMIKILNSPSQFSITYFCQLKYSGKQTSFEEFKSENNVGNFEFAVGDLLKFTAFSALGERTITSSPTGDQTYYFHYTGDPCQGIPTVTDIDGNIYNTVQIGDQCWLKENLKTTKYNNGTPIPNITDFNEWQGLLTGAYVWYDNDLAWKEKYGALYNWFAAVDSNGLCPSGWHVPDNFEWGALESYVGGSMPPYGNTLKSCRQINSPLGGYCATNEHPRWEEDVNNGNYGTDDYGFSGLPGGYRDPSLDFLGIGGVAFWWSSTDGYPTWWGWTLMFNYGVLGQYLNFYRQDGFSIRCIKD